LVLVLVLKIFSSYLFVILGDEGGFYLTFFVCCKMEDKKEDKKEDWRFSCII